MLGFHQQLLKVTNETLHGRRVSSYESETQDASCYNENC